MFDCSIENDGLKVYAAEKGSALMRTQISTLTGVTWYTREDFN